MELGDKQTFLILLDVSSDWVHVSFALTTLGEDSNTTNDAVSVEPVEALKYADSNAVSGTDSVLTCTVSVVGAWTGPINVTFGFQTTMSNDTTMPLTDASAWRAITDTDMTITATIPTAAVPADTTTLVCDITYPVQDVSHDDQWYLYGPDWVVELGSNFPVAGHVAVNVAVTNIGDFNAIPTTVSIAVSLTSDGSAVATKTVTVPSLGLGERYFEVVSFS